MNRISEAEDGKRYRQAMFADALGHKRYLGNPSVVGALVGDYCLAVRDMLVERSTGELASDEFVARVNEMGRELSAIFLGRDPDYKPIIGWNAISLAAHLQVALGSYWAEYRDSHANDPVKVLFAWLCWAVYDAMDRANGDDDLEAVILSEHTGAAIRLLLGADCRA
ncbi:MAG TPA: hypothetical protein VF472_07235 [Burkholderiaceae bacterium]